MSQPPLIKAGGIWEFRQLNMTNPYPFMWTLQDGSSKLGLHSPGDLLLLVECSTVTLPTNAEDAWFKFVCTVWLDGQPTLATRLISRLSTWRALWEEVVPRKHRKGNRV